MGGVTAKGGCANNSCFSGVWDGTPSGKQAGSRKKPTKACDPSSAWASPVKRPAALSACLDFNLACVNANLDSDSWVHRALYDSDVAQHGRWSKFEVEQLVASPGTLPRSAPVLPPTPTATRQILGKVPRKMLELATTDAQALRRNLVYCATMVFISAGYPGKRFIFERAAALGVRCVIIDHPDSWSQALVADGVAAKFIPVDMSQSSEAIFSQVERLVRGLGNDGLTGRADGITTFVELFVPFTARLCETLGLPSLGSQAVDAAHDKYQTLVEMDAAGLPTQRNSLIRQVSDLPAAGKLVGFPAVLKPVSGAACLGVKQVGSMAELQSCYADFDKELRSLVISSDAKVESDDTPAGLAFLLMQQLDGCQVDVDIVMSEDQCRYAAVSDNGIASEPYFCDFSRVCPPLLSKDIQSSLTDYAVRSVQSLGLSTGVFHVELRHTPDGPRLIQVNARMGGGPVRESNRLVWGVDLVEEVLFCALGIPSRPVVPLAPNTCVGYTYVTAKISGTIRNASKSFEALRSRQGVLFSDSLVELGDKVAGTADGLPTRVGLLVVARPHPQQALDHMIELQRSMSIQIDA